MKAIHVGDGKVYYVEMDDGRMFMRTDGAWWVEITEDNKALNVPDHEPLEKVFAAYRKDHGKPL